MNAVFKHREWHRKLNIIALSVALIAVGLLLVGRNLGYVDPTLFGIIVSWQMLLVYIGLLQMIKLHFVGGLLLMAVGGYFLAPDSLGLSDYWPVLLVVAGLAMLLQLMLPGGKKEKWFRWHTHWADAHKEQATSEDGYVRANVSFGESNQIVLDPVFRGADVSVSFGSVVLDLRRCTLEAATTVIHVNANFSGLEIYVPLRWYVVIEADTTLSGIDDKRVPAADMDRDHQLVVRGDMAFSGLEIKG
jgi:hypothetical protein